MTTTNPYTLPRREVPVAVSSRSRAVAEVEIRPGGELSICATVTSTGGDFRGGQCLDSLESEAARIAVEPGGRRMMSPADVSALVGIWRRWHLNHMRPGCEHQTGPEWNVSARIEFRTYSIAWDDNRQLERTEEREARAAGITPEGKGSDGRDVFPFGHARGHGGQQGTMPPSAREAWLRFSNAARLLAYLRACGVKPFQWSTIEPRAVALLSEDFEFITEAERPAYLAEVAKHAQGLAWRWKGKNRPSFYAPKPPLLVRIETKTAGWLRPSEHPAGLLTKPCPVCGYEYGSESRKEPLPAEVVAELLRIVNGAPDAPSESDQFAALGFKLTCRRTNTRPESHNWPADARHWLCRLERNRQVMKFPYTQGSAHKEPPTLADVLDCLRSDARLAEDESEAQACGVKLSQWETLKRQAHAFRLVVGDAAEALGL